MTSFIVGTKFQTTGVYVGPWVEGTVLHSEETTMTGRGTGGRGRVVLHPQSGSREGNVGAKITLHSTQDHEMVLFTITGDLPPRLTSPTNSHIDMEKRFLGDFMTLAPSPLNSFALVCPSVKWPWQLS